jgi:alanyl-tRNA synthetase
MRKAQKHVAEENKRKVVMITTEKADLAVSDRKPFCISHVDVGLDVAAVRDAVKKVIDQKVFANS